MKLLVTNILLVLIYDAHTEEFEYLIRSGIYRPIGILKYNPEITKRSEILIQRSTTELSLDPV